jgi:hypothetical protein
MQAQVYMLPLYSQKHKAQNRIANFGHKGQISMLGAKNWRDREWVCFIIKWIFN